jgi:hypothetical protein
MLGEGLLPGRGVNSDTDRENAGAPPTSVDPGDIGEWPKWDDCVEKLRTKSIRAPLAQ